jgi:hypothetical protein
MVVKILDGSSKASIHPIQALSRTVYIPRKSKAVHQFFEIFSKVWGICSLIFIELLQENTQIANSDGV